MRSIWLRKARKHARFGRYIFFGTKPLDEPFPFRTGMESDRKRFSPAKVQSNMKGRFDMLKKLFTTAAAGAILVSATAAAPTAFAQDATRPLDPAAESPSTVPGTAPAVPDGSTSSTAPTAPATEVTGVYLSEQAPDHISANTYIGQSVYNPADEDVGKISDLIMDRDGGIVAAVVGVGGFLGIGQKNVAVPIAKIEVIQNPTDGSLKLTTSETSETLKAAPEFKTLAMVQSEKDAGTTGSVTRTPDTTQ